MNKNGWRIGGVRIQFTSHARSLVSGVWVDNGDQVNEPSSLIVNVSIIAAIQRGSVNDWTLPAMVISGRMPMQSN